MMRKKYRIYRLIYNSCAIGYRLITELGVFDTCLESLEEYIGKLSITGDIEVFEKDGNYLSEYEIEHSISYKEVGKYTYALFILLNLIGKKQLPLNIDIGDTLLIRATARVSNYNKRFCFPMVQEFLDSQIGEMCNVLAIFGLRRTGKTVLIQQAIQYLLSKGVSSTKIAYITLRNNDLDPLELMGISESLFNDFDIDYLFIDEFTFVKGDMSFATIYSDVYTDKKTIISGTNSVGFLPLLSDTLYRRTVKIPTTYISFKEFAFLSNTNITVLGYVKSGGILGKDLTYANTHIDLDNLISSASEYFRTSIIDNLFGGIRCFSSVTDRFSLLANLYYKDKNKLITLLNNWLQNYGKDLILSIIKDILVGSADMSMTVYNMSRGRGKASWKLFKEDVRQLYLSELGMVDKANSFTDEELQEVKQFLKVIDCYVSSDITNYRKSDETSSSRMAFLVPVLLRYALLETLVSVLDSNYDSLDAKYALGVSYSEFKKRLLSTANGKLFEDVIYLELINAGYDIGVYRDSNEEVDFVYRTKEGYHLYEIKLTDSIYLSDLKWLTSSSVLKRFNPVKIGVICNIDTDTVINCTELDIMNAIADKFRKNNPNKLLPVAIKSKLDTADANKVYQVHYINASKFLKELKEVRD